MAGLEVSTTIKIQGIGNGRANAVDIDILETILNPFGGIVVNQNSYLVLADIVLGENIKIGTALILEIAVDSGLVEKNRVASLVVLEEVVNILFKSKGEELVFT